MLLIKKTLILFSMIIIAIVVMGCSGGETSYKVTLTVKLAEDSKFFVIEEVPPAGAMTSDLNLLEADNQGHLKYVEFQNAEDKTLSYVVAATDPTFSGEFHIDGVTGNQEVQQIKGQMTPDDPEPTMDAPGVYRTITKVE